MAETDAAGTCVVNNRIKSVKNISKITKSMKMVAAAKLRRAQALMAQTQAYVGGLQRFMESEVCAVLCCVCM